MPNDRNGDTVQTSTSTEQQGVKASNKFICLVGLFLFFSATAILISGFIPAQLNSTLLIMTSFVGLGLILFSVGDEAKFTGPGFNIVGAGAITLILIYAYSKFDNEINSHRSKIYPGTVKIGSEKILKSGGTNPLPTSAVISTHNATIKSTKEDVVGDFPTFSFRLTPEEANQMRSEPCLILAISMSDGSSKNKRFFQSKMIASGFGRFFDLLYHTDTDKIYYHKEDISNAVLLDECNNMMDSLNTVRTETNVNVVPPAAPVVAGSPAASTAANANGGGSASNTPKTQTPATRVGPNVVVGDSQAIPAVSNQIVGYVIYSELEKDSTQKRRAWFTVESDDTSRLPKPNDILIGTRDKVALRQVPYHWDGQKYSMGDPIAYISADQRSKVAGDAFITKDQNTKRQYVILPIGRVYSVPGNKTMELKTFDQTIPELNLKSIVGFAYGGYLNAGGDDYAVSLFENLTRPESPFPVLNDVMKATGDVWIRRGPRRWDGNKGDYVNAAVVRSIRRGQYVRVGGDTVLSAGGSAVWIPISGVYDSMMDASPSQ